MCCLTQVCFGLLGLSPAALASDWMREVGYENLSDRLGTKRMESLGAGVGISQIEAPSANGGYLPQTAHGLGEFNGTAAFAGKAFRRRSNGSEISEHARIVGHFLYGAEPFDAFAAVSLAPGINEVDLYKAGVSAYLGSDFLRVGMSDEPARELNAIQNHAWSGKVGTASMAYLDEVLLRLDYAIARDGFLCVAALKNGSDQPIPPLVASAYNVLAVGRSDGEHSRGTTHAGLSGPERSKTDLVAPLSATSFATSVVSSAAAVLVDEGSVATEKRSLDSARSEVLRAILMAGASKAPFPSWSHSPSSPFDPVYGAGQIDVCRSHEILTNQTWRSESLGKGEAWEMAFEIGRKGAALSAVLAWNREVGMKRGRVKSDALANMIMSLHQLDTASDEYHLISSSDSPHENREHLYSERLPGGRYVIRIETDRSVRFGLAWHLEAASRGSIELEWLGKSTLLGRGLMPGRSYQLQSSHDLKEWVPVETFSASAEDSPAWVHRIESRDHLLGGRMRFYRLVETIRSKAP